MGLISGYINKVVDKRLNQLINGDINGGSILFDKNYSLEQNKVLYRGDTSEILRWYKTHRPRNAMYTTNLFWRVVTGNAPIQHYPLANIITKTMVNLLFSDNPRVEALSGNLARDKKLNATLDDILKENEFGDLLQRSVELESYSGVVAYKFVMDPDFSDNPIIQAYPKEDIEVIKQYDRLSEIIFKDYYEVKDNKYVLWTICGRGYIDYKLFRDGKKLEEVSVDTLDETRGLSRLEIMNSDGTPYKDILAIYKENKAGGLSDYNNLYDDFAALDEIYSNMIDFIRKSRIKTYIPETLLDQDVQTGKRSQRNEYDSSDIVLHDSNPAGTTQEVKRDIVDINNSIQGYKDAFNNTLLNALSTAGLSPCSIGLDIAGANSSALALNIRERVSLRTRSEKQKRWTEALEKLAKLLLSLSGAKVVEGKMYLNTYDKDIKVTFPEYETPSFSEQVATLSQALDANLIDLESALKMLYPDKSDEEIELMRFMIEGQLPDEEEIVNRELEKEEETEVNVKKTADPEELVDNSN